MSQMSLRRLDEECEERLQQVLACLLALSLDGIEATTLDDRGTIQSVARWALLKSTKNLSASDFVVAARSMLRSKDQKVCLHTD